MDQTDSDWVEVSTELCIIDGAPSDNFSLDLDAADPCIDMGNEKIKMVWDRSVGIDVVVDKKGEVSHAVMGGFSSVYIVKSENQSLVLKRSCVPPDQRAYQNAVNEIEILRLAKGNPYIVQLYDHKINSIMQGGFEVLLLLEHCSGGSVVDLMNKNPSFNEPEVNHIFISICRAVKWCHSQGITHRDLKVENVLICNDYEFKLCDFGSATKNTVPKGVTLSIDQIRLLDDEINKYTTLAYRAPEICDLYHTKGISNKVDIWALGVLLYKLCFYTTPFEETGKLAILNCRYTIPQSPIYSKNLLLLIQNLLLIDSDQRPDIDQTINYINHVQKDFPLALTSNVFLPKSQKSILMKPAQSIPTKIESVNPMRRGRPNASHGNTLKGSDGSEFWNSWESPISSAGTGLRSDLAEFDPLFSGGPLKRRVSIIMTNRMLILCFIMLSVIAFKSDQQSNLIRRTRVPIEDLIELLHKSAAPRPILGEIHEAISVPTVPNVLDGVDGLLGLRGKKVIGLSRVEQFSKGRRQMVIARIADGIKPGWRKYLPETYSYSMMAKQLTRLSKSDKGKLILSYFRLLHWANMGKDPHIIPWKALSHDDLVGWPRNVPIINLKLLSHQELDEIIKNLYSIQLQPSFSEKVFEAGYELKAHH